MSDVIQAALFPETLSDVERAEAQAALAASAEARQVYRAAQALEAHVATAFQAGIPPRRLLVLDALARSRYAEMLSDAERAEISEHADTLAQARDAHPSLAYVAREIAHEAAQFEKAWQGEAAPPLRTKPSDRALRRQAPVQRWLWRTGVTMALLAFVAAALLIVQRDASYTTVEVATGEVQHLTLGDGSRVKLMGGAALTYSDPEAGAVFNRQVRLRGDAFFEVEPGVQRFTVRTEEADVMVLGTAFGVRAGQAGTEVTLVEGQLLFAPAGMPTRGVTLAPGQQSRVAHGADLPTPPADVAVDATLQWAGLFIFSDTPLATVTARLSEGFGTTIEVSPALAQEAITGTFDRAQGVEEIVQTLATALGAEAVETASGWRIVQ